MTRNKRFNHIVDSTSVESEASLVKTTQASASEIRDYSKEIKQVGFFHDAHPAALTPTKIAEPQIREVSSADEKSAPSKLWLVIVILLGLGALSLLFFAFA